MIVESENKQPISVNIDHIVTVSSNDKTGKGIDIHTSDGKLINCTISFKNFNSLLGKVYNDENYVFHNKT